MALDLYEIIEFFDKRALTILLIIVGGLFYVFYLIFTK